ncbi:MAG: YbaK/EbsC family protein [Anaerolineales bacterium]|jgi:prolyl-tRNA editing enzyme YbaK/EbsC (Cys-tRNA(Pro) deacylase)
MSKPLSKSARRVQDALDKQGKDFQVIELPDSTRTAVEAARAVGCQLGQIVKSLVFKAKRSKRPVLVIASGANRVDERKIEALIGEPLGKADADFVRSSTGFAIGGVPPVGHDPEMPVFIDNDLLQYDEVWAAAGTPHAVFRLDPHDLQPMTGGKLVDIK